ncbi:MAG: translesion error-prone DNA polymerase V autoproteolytic subunit [Balneolales bacterium]|nr:translesion error-prone DNA polymerase V autoproteolytic subunit [Balneolales bacterium]
MPLYQDSVQAGFPSPAQDHLEKELDLNEHLITNPVSTFFVRVQGESMADAQIHTGDILIVDRSMEPIHNRIVVAILNGEFTVKRLYKKDNELMLLPENDAFQPIVITPETDFEVWGVVSWIIHKAK